MKRLNCDARKLNSAWELHSSVSCEQEDQKCTGKALYVDAYLTT